MTAQVHQHQQQAQRKPSLVRKFADKFSIDERKLLDILKATAFRQRDGLEITDEQLAALLIVADQYNLNPFTKEIYAFPDRQNGIVPVVGVDGWARIINDHPQCDGFEFVESEERTKFEGKDVPVSMEVVLYRKDRSHPTRIRESFQEVVRGTPPWKSHPSRMLRHKTLIQGARIAFGFSGIFDEDEAQRVIDARDAQVVPAGESDVARSASERMRRQLTAQHSPQSVPLDMSQVGVNADPFDVAPAPHAAAAADPVFQAPPVKPDGEPEADGPATSSPPSVNFEMLRDQLFDAESVDALEQLISLADALPEAVRLELHELYRERRAALEA